MKMLIKRAVCLVLAAVLSLSLCSCSLFDADISALISPPSPKGELGEIQKALISHAGDNFSLEHPASGEYLSPIITKDIDADGENEAFAFYSTAEAGSITMHLAFINDDDNGWQTCSDTTITAGGVDKIEFSDIDNDGILELLVGWSLYGDIDKQVAIYDLAKGVLVQRLIEEYSFFLIADINNDSNDNLLVAHHDSTDKTAVAKLFSIKSDNISEIGSCELDGGVTEYKTPLVSTLANGKTAVYVDAVKGSGIITELIYHDGTLLKNAFIEQGSNVNLATQRDAEFTLLDFDNDGRPEIPFNTILPGTADTYPAYITLWCTFDGTSLYSKGAAMMNYIDGYYVLLPESWKSDRITVSKLVDSKLRIFSLWDTETSAAGNELLRIKAVPIDQWDKSAEAHGEYEELLRSDTYVIAALISSYAGDEAITSAQLKNMIGLIK